jgi:hypothetical protein
MTEKFTKVCNSKLNLRFHQYCIEIFHDFSPLGTLKHKNNFL